MQSLDDAIKDCEEVAEKNEEESKNWAYAASQIIDDENRKKQYQKHAEMWREFASEHRQMAEWLRELKKLKSEDSWIPCREKQPDKTGQYLVTIKYRHDKKGYMYMTARRNYYAEYQTWEDSLVIAWQPLPEPYTEGSCEE